MRGDPQPGKRYLLCSCPRSTLNLLSKCTVKISLVFGVTFCFTLKRENHFITLLKTYMEIDCKPWRHTAWKTYSTIPTLLLRSMTIPNLRNVHYYYYAEVGLSTTWKRIFRPTTYLALVREDPQPGKRTLLLA